MAIEILDATYGDANNTLTSGQKSSSFQLLASYLVNASAATRLKNLLFTITRRLSLCFPPFLAHMCTFLTPREGHALEIVFSDNFCIILYS